MGVELEIDGGGEINSHAESLMDIANTNGLEHIFCKHDGSLEDGFEIVGHPMSLDYHLNEMPWGNILSKATSTGYTSHLARTCGLHVHVSRNAFGETEAQQDAVIARILYFFEKHWDELLKFSRRTPRQLEQWAARYGYKEQPMEILDHAKKGRHGGRYTCVNLTNTDTIEFRIFDAGHTAYLSFLQTCMEFFCDAIVAGIPLRGCIATGMALMDQDKSIYFGNPLVEAARGEPAQNALGIAYGKSFNNYHPVYNDYFIPYLDHIKENNNKSAFLSPMVLDWPRYWRHSSKYKDCSIAECINKMNLNPSFSSYYDNAIKFAEFSPAHENWPNEINREGMGDITAYYKRTTAWFRSLK